MCPNRIHHPDSSIIADENTWAFAQKTICDDFVTWRQQYRHWSNQTWIMTFYHDIKKSNGFVYIFFYLNINFSLLIPLVPMANSYICNKYFSICYKTKVTSKTTVNDNSRFRRNAILKLLLLFIFHYLFHYNRILTKITPFIVSTFVFPNKLKAFRNTRIYIYIYIIY